MENLNLIVRETGEYIGDTCNIRRAGYYKNSPIHYMERLKEEVIEEGIIIYCLSGEGFLEAEGKKTIVTKGDLVYCPPFEPHIYGANPDKPWQIQWVHFTGIINELILEKLCHSTVSQVIKGDYDANIDKGFGEIISKIKKNADKVTLMEMHGLFQVLVADMIHRKTQKTSNNQETIVDKSKAYMLAHLDEQITVDMLASFCNLSKYYYVRQFKSISGKTPMAYLLVLKMDKASSLLTSTERSIALISDQLGYNNQFYFSQCFKKYTTYTPTQYRKMMTDHY